MGLMVFRQTVLGRNLLPVLQVQQIAASKKCYLGFNVSKFTATLHNSAHTDDGNITIN
jgi:hypothetical protein